MNNDRLIFNFRFLVEIQMFVFEHDKGDKSDGRMLIMVSAKFNRRKRDTLKTICALKNVLSISLKHCCTDQLCDCLLLFPRPVTVKVIVGIDLRINILILIEFVHHFTMTDIL